MATKATKAQVLRGARWNTKAGVRSRGIDRTKATWKRCFSVTFDEEVSSDAYLVLVSNGSTQRRKTRSNWKFQWNSLLTRAHAVRA